MASLQLSPATLPATATTFFQKKPFFIPTYTRVSKRSSLPRVSCQATKNPNSEDDKQMFDRRNVLIGLGGLYGAAGLITDPFAFAAPITAPDLAKCGKADLPAGAPAMNCCPPPASTIIDFKIPTGSNTLRVRPAAHLASNDYIAKFEKAIELMKALPDDDPRSFKQQTAVHCAYCDGAYHQVGFPNLELQVHDSWLFFPFHRYYLYFFEKILGKLIDDPTFAIPFWNWDAPAGMPMPAFYTNPNSPLYNPRRNANHVKTSSLVDLDYNGVDSVTTNEKQVSDNLAIMYRQMVSNSKSASLFLGSAYRAGFPNLELQVHDSWLFFPFHRYYLYFFEKILGKLIDDPTFAIPFWNWDSPAGMPMPAFYTNPNSPLYNPRRNASHVKTSSLVDLDYNGVDSVTTNEKQVSDNLAIMYRQMVSNSKSASLFLGSAYRAGDDSDPGAGSVENMPHGAVHIWCGDNTQPNLEDMGNFYSAARDPIFYGHHANVDRMWTVWKTLDGSRRTEFTDPDWLDASLLFYDENAQAVRVKVRDCIDNAKLGYTYQDVAIPWLDSKPTPRVRPTKTVAQKSGIAQAAETPKTPTRVRFPITLDKKISTLVSRPKTSRTQKEKDEEDEVLVIEGIEFERDEFLKFDVFINDEHDSLTTPANTEFAGSFVNVPHKHKHGKKMNTVLRLGIGDLLDDLDCDSDENVVVSLVPKVGSGRVTIGGIKIEFAD